MLAALSRAAFSVLAGSRTTARLASRYGMRRPDSFARRFVAGETVEEAITAAAAIERAGRTVTLDLLGEGVKTTEAADAATRSYIAVLDAIAAAGVSRNISLKLTQLGLEIDEATCLDNLRKVLDAATRHDAFVRIDMENSPYTAATLEIFEALWQMGHRNVGVVLQSYLRRSLDDARRMNALGARVRLVKGAYREPKDVAYQDRADVDAAFVEIMQVLLRDGTDPAIATHDEALIEQTKTFAEVEGIGRDRFEFQMLYGVRRDLHTALSEAGYRFRVYVPFGREWFPYFMRRLGERPANVGFVLRSLVRER